MAVPRISIIVPVLNAEDHIERFIHALIHQNYPSEDYEIIVVDNGSSDRTRERVSAYKKVILLEEDEIQNPYAARNKGLRNARGNILALLDVNCTPVKHWLSSGVKLLSNEEADLVGGHVTFTFSQEESLGEWYDSLLFVDMEDLIERGKSCAGGNLFFKRAVLDTIGYFPDSQRSGTDLYWTKKATNVGFHLIYSPDAEVRYPARKLRPLLKKVFRVGTGQPVIWLRNGMNPVKMVALIFYQIIPPGSRKLKSKIKRRGKEIMNHSFFSLWLIHYLQNMVIAAGWTKGLITYYFSR